MLSLDRTVLRPVIKDVDPRAFLLTGVVFLLTVVLLDAPFLLAFIIVCSFLILIRQAGTVIKRLIAVNFFVLFIWFTVPFTADAQTALLYTLKINASALIFMIFIAHLTVGDLANVLTALKCPGKLASVIVLAAKYIAVLSERLNTSLLAMQLRKPAQTGIFRQWRNYAALFATVVIKAALREDRVVKSMISRGFDGTLPRTRCFHWRLFDSFFMCTGFLFSLLLWYIGQCLK